MCVAGEGGGRGFCVVGGGRGEAFGNEEES